MMIIRQGVLLEKKHGFDMERETDSNIKYLRGMGKQHAKCRLVVAVSGTQGARGVPYHLT